MGKKHERCTRTMTPFFYEIQTKDVYEDLKSLREDLDFSSYPKKNHFL